jgi:hypothetical protein
VIVTKLALGFGVLLCVLLVWMALSGVAIATELLVSAIAIVVLVGGGNWLAGRGGRYPAAPPAEHEVGGEGQGAGGKETGGAGQ